MPIVPRVNPTVREIGNLPGVRNETRVSSAPVEGLADAVRGVAQVGQDIYKQHQDRADAASLMEADRKVSDWYNNWHDPNNEKGVRAYQGRNALTLRESMLPDFDRVTAEIEASLPSDTARMKFKASAAVQREQADRWVNGYANGEIERYEAAENKAWTETTVNDLTTAELAGDPDRAAVVWGVALDRVVSEGAARGRPIEETKARVQAMKGAVRAGVIDRKMIESPSAALEYYNQHFGDMDQDTRTRIEAKLYPIRADAIADDDVRWATGGGTVPEYEVGPRGQPTAEVAAILNNAADANGVGREYAYAIAEQESGFRVKAVNPEKINGDDNATGLFQWSAESAAEWGITDRNDPVQSANAAMRRFKKNMDAHGPDFAMAAHFGGEGGAAAVVLRGRTAENPRTAAYLGQVRARARQWAGHSGKPSESAAPAPAALDRATALERIQSLPIERRQVAEAKLRDQFQIEDIRKAEAARAAEAEINEAVWTGDPNRPLREVLGPDRWNYAVANGLVKRLTDDLIFRRGDKTRVDNPDVVGPYLAMMRENPDEFAKMSVTRNARHMTPDTEKALLDAQEAVRTGKGTHDYASESEQLNALVYSKLGILPGVKNVEAMRAPIELGWFKMKREFAKKHPGRDPNANEREEMMSRLAKSYALAGLTWDAGKMKWKAGTPSEVVPNSERQLILSSNRAKARIAAGEPVDEQWIRSMYLSRNPN